MDKNVKIAKRLIKIAKSLVSANNYLFPDLHDVEVNECYMAPAFDEMTYNEDYERIGSFEDGVYLYGSLRGKKPSDIFDMKGLNEEWVDAYGDDWGEFFSETSQNLNNATYEIPLKQEYGYTNAKGVSQSDWVQVIYNKSEVKDTSAFDEFFYGNLLLITVTIDGDVYTGYDILDDLSHYSKRKVIDALKSKLGNAFSDDVKSQLEKLLPEDDKIEYLYY